MCGISGIIRTTGLLDTDKDVVLRMRKSLDHRGPDGEGLWLDQHVCLGHNRLSILDLSDNGNQPMEYEDLIIIYNGEIYNYIEIKEELIGLGYTFQSTCDTEVVLLAYHKWGSKCLNKFRGMFAIVIWNKLTKELFFARDRMGQKPFYLCELDEHTTIFASELRSLVYSGLVDIQIDPIAIDKYFHYQYVPEPRTPLKHVRKLPASCFMVVKKNGERHEQEYWNILNAPAVEGKPAVLIRNCLEDISRIIKRSDVPVGIALSAGLDSSIIAALQSMSKSKKVHAFCVGYTGYPESCDERKEARKLAKQLGITFHEIELSDQDFIDFFPKQCSLSDDPIADISGFCYYSVMKAAADAGVKVMMQGQGADELFFGYGWVKNAVIDSMQAFNSKYSVLKALSTAIARKWRNPRAFKARALARWAIDCAGVPEIISEYFRLRGLNSEDLSFYDQTYDFRRARKRIGDYYTPEFRKLVKSSKHKSFLKRSIDSKDMDKVITSAICRTYLIGNGITQADRLSMASSVESRLPFVDYKLVELAMGLRHKQKDYNRRSKIWLKHAVKDILPEDVINRKKTGFVPPVRKWTKLIFKEYGHVLENGALVEAGILSEKGTAKLAKGIFPKNACATLSYKALVLELWYRKIKELKLQ